MIFGTSTGSIIASLLALGFEVDEVHHLYRQYVPTVMKPRKPAEKSATLARLADDVFGAATFEDVKTGIGVVVTKWAIEKPMIFKGHIEQAHGRKGTFVPGFGATVGDGGSGVLLSVPLFRTSNP